MNKSVVDSGESTITSFSPLPIPTRADNAKYLLADDLIIWSVIDGFLLVVILCGNTLTILAVRYSRRLRSTISNLFILSLAISDLVVGLTLPYHLAFYIGTEIGQIKFYCILRFFLIIFAWCLSIWNLMAIAIDRYIAICYPLHYTRYMTRRAALCHIGIGYLFSLVIAITPVFWNNYHLAEECEFNEVITPWYVAGVIAPAFSIVWICLLITYSRIWHEAAKHVKQMRSSGQDGPSDWKSVQVVLLILGCFTVCWMPYLVITSAQLFKYFEHGSARFYKAVFCLAMANSGVNPLIYAWKNSAFRRAFGKLLRCQKPDGGGADQDVIESMRSAAAAARKSSSMLQRQDTFNSTRTDFGTPPSSARPRTNSSDIDSSSDIIHTMHRGSITDSGVVVIMKHKRLSSLSSEHRYSQTTISEESASNLTAVVMFSSQEVESASDIETPRKQVEQQQQPPRKEIPPVRNAKLIRNKCAILESFDSVSDDSRYSPDPKEFSPSATAAQPKTASPDVNTYNNPNSNNISSKRSIFNFKHVCGFGKSSADAPKAMQSKTKQQSLTCKVNENFETVVC